MDADYSKKGYHIRQSQAIAFGVLVGSLCLMVGLMCGLLPQAPTCALEDPPTEEPPPTEPQTTEPKTEAPPVTEGRTTVQGPMTTIEQGPWTELRLPETVIPEHYTLLLHPNLTTDRFTGHVDIEITVTEAIKYPRLHIKEMSTQNVEVLNGDGASIPIERTFNYVPNEFLVIEMVTELEPGRYTLSMDFNGSLVGHIVGFYKSVYTTANGEPRAIATSKFQPTDARRAFPCFDEPNLKANYTTSLVHPEDYIALSNMDVQTIEDYENDLKVTRFNTSVKMSTYLACFIVCQFDYKENFTASGTPFRVYAPPDQIDQVDYALRVGVNVTDYFEYYFDIPYPLPKLDMIAIPDFVSGAMEHWGLITYREVNLLFDDRESAASNKQRIASVVAHELAHMWFGNLVTMDWWDDLWLNEGFASYVEYIGADHAEPTWLMMDQFASTDLYYVMGLDQIVSSHPIIVEVNNPDEINEVFDSISYSKGASVIRMLNNFLGEDNFRAGVTDYLNKYAYSTAVTDDLWESLSQVSNVDVKNIMDTWTRQMGFPVVTMKRMDDSGTIQLLGEQDWFLVDPQANKSQDLYGSNFGYKWQIPFFNIFESQTEVNEEFIDWNGDDFQTPWDGAPTDWFFGNAGQMGYYRVNYDNANWDALSQHLLTSHDSRLSSVERSGLIDDSFNLARADQLNYTIPLDLVQYLENEEDYVPWDTATDNILWLGEMMRFQPGYGEFRIFVRQLARQQFLTLGWEDQGSHLERFLRSDIILLSCAHGDPDCLNEAVNKFYDYLNGSFIPANIRSLVYRFGMEQVGGQEEWNALFQNYSDSTVSSERSRLLSAMARTRIPWLLSNYLDMLLIEDSPVREQDFFSVVSYIAANPVGNPLAWDWARVRWEELVERFTVSNRYLGRMVPDITEFYATELQLQEMKDFFARYPDAGAGERGRQQALERVQGNINWVQQNAEVVQDWLMNNVEMSLNI